MKAASTASKCSSSKPSSAAPSITSASHLLEPRLLGRRARALDHPGRDVDPDRLAGRADPPRRGQQRAARPAADVEHAAAGAEQDELGEPLAQNGACWAKPARS